MTKEQNASWGLGYIDLLLIHFPCALTYIDPEIRKYPVSPQRPSKIIQLTEPFNLVLVDG